MTDDEERLYTIPFKSYIKVSKRKLAKTPADSPFRVVFEGDEEEDGESEDEDET